MNQIGLKKVTYFIIRHKATNTVMPQLKGKGYSHWNPNQTENQVSLRKLTGCPRLFETKNSAYRAIVQWNACPNAYNGWHDTYDGGEPSVNIKPDERSKDDLEIIKVRLVKV